MILDSQLCFTTTAGQAVAAVADTVSTDTLDLGAKVRIQTARVSFVATAVGGTTPTLKVDLYGDTAPGFGTEKLLGTRAIVAADLVANKVYHFDAPPAAPYQYYRLKFTMTGTTPTSTVQAYLVDEELVQTDILLAGVGVP
jgi:hypothetical protein